MEMPVSSAPSAMPPACKLRRGGLPTLLAPSGRQFIALLADDNPVNREIGIAMLEQLGLQVHVADDGREAVEKAAATPYDVVLMDLQMPRLDGLGATLEIRALPQCRQVPVIAITANAFEHCREACLAAGMNDFLSKPVNVWQMADALARWLPR